MTTSQWGASVKKWSLVGNRDSLKGINVVADHRCSFGDESLCGVLREALHAATQGSQAFYFNLAKAALGYRPPLESLGRWSPERGTATINLKDALTPVGVTVLLKMQMVFWSIRPCRLSTWSPPHKHSTS